MRPILLRAFLLFATLAYSTGTLAFETDQYNLPPTPLADIGEEVAEYTEDNILKAVSKINAEIVLLQACRDRPDRKKCGSAEKLQARLAYLRSDEAIMREVFKRLGGGPVPFTKAGSWMNSHKFRGQPARYKTSYRRSIFVYVPSNYFTISPTVNMFGHSLGTDKIAHIFQQGYTYQRIRVKARAKGVSDADAVREAVEWGKMTERTYFGTLVSGVFSNADLAANFAGMRYYEGLVKPLKVGATERPATLVLKNGLWIVNPAPSWRQTLIAPFISDHLNEALNPSLYLPGLRSAIRGIVRKQSCRGWIAAYPNSTRSEFELRTASLVHLHGDDYGHKGSENVVTIANTCFDSPRS